ncbi:MAG: Ger(x)C family spore germination protein [Bacilli bacterium]
MKKIKYIILLLPLLSGCYNYRELNELGITTAVSIDYKDNNFILIAEVVNPIKQQDVSASNNSPFVNFTSVAPSIQEAFRNTVLESPRQLYLSQLEIILVSEEIINNHLEEFLEFFSREPETRTEIKVIIAKTEESTKGITIQSLLTNFSSSNILESLEVQNKLLGLTQEVTINELLNMYLDPNLEIVLPSMILYGSSDIGDEKENITTSTPKTLVKVGTTSVIKDGKILGYLSEEESKMVNLINGNLTKTILKIPYEDGYVVFEPNRIKTKQKLNIKDNKITIEISGFSKIKEFHTNKNIKNMKTVEELNKYFNKEIENMIKDNFNQIREKYNTDMYGFQELYYRTDHKYFKKYCSNWYETTFPNIKLEVKSNIKLYEKGNTLGGIKYERENN